MEWVPNMADPDTKIRLLNAGKFARLIVAECANYAFSDDQERDAMLKHFGVEE